MNGFPQFAHAVSPVAAGVLAASIWEGLLLTGAVALGLRAVRTVRPAARFWIWMSVLLLVLLLPVLSLGGAHASGPARDEIHVNRDWSLVLVGVWAAVSVFRAARLAVNGVRLWALARRAVPVVPDEGTAALLRMGRRAELCVSEEIDRPSVAGFFRPRVLLPAGLMETLSPAELEHVVLHELEHLRRGDDWLNLVQQISLVLLPLNPALIWLDRRLCRERELACDDGVLRATGAGKAYAACLVKLAEDSLLRKGVALALSALGTRARESELVGRVRRILARPEGEKDGTRWGALGAIAAGIAVCATLLASSPELVRFDGAPQVLAQAASAEIAPRASEFGGMRPVSARAGDVRPVLVKAVMPQPVASVRPVAAVAVVRRRPAVRRVPRAGMDVQQPWVTVPVMVQRREAVPSRAVLTGFRVSELSDLPERGFSTTWAAVPVRGGWLIVQL